MGIENIRHLKKGDRLKAADINAIVDYLKQHPVNVTPGGLPNNRPQTLFYTASYIPEFSIFPLIPSADETDNTYYAQYCVEQYNSEHECRYIRGYFGTNGRYPIPAHSTFYGQIITRDFDTPIRVSDYDYEDNKTQCGFKDGSWEASVKSTGLVLNGKAPHEDGTCYARLLDTGDIYLLELKHDIPPGIDRCGKICVTSGEAWVMDREKNGACKPICGSGSGSESEGESDDSESDTCDKLVRRYELNEPVYNNTRYIYKAKDKCGKPIIYYGYRDIFGTIWVGKTYGKTDEDFECCSSSSSSSSSSGGSSQGSSVSEGSEESYGSEGSESDSIQSDSAGSEPWEHCGYTGDVNFVISVGKEDSTIVAHNGVMHFKNGILCSWDNSGDTVMDICDIECDGEPSSAASKPEEPSY